MSEKLPAFRCLDEGWRISLDLWTRRYHFWFYSSVFSLKFEVCDRRSNNDLFVIAFNEIALTEGIYSLIKHFLWILSAYRLNPSLNIDDIPF